MENMTILQQDLFLFPTERERERELQIEIVHSPLLSILVSHFR